MGDGYVDEWIQSLEALKALDFTTIIPGHGAPYSDRTRIDRFQAYLRDLWQQATALKAVGVPADEAATPIDLMAHRPVFSQIQRPGVDVRAVQRIYDVIDARVRKPGP